MDSSRSSIGEKVFHQIGRLVIWSLAVRTHHIRPCPIPRSVGIFVNLGNLLKLPEIKIIIQLHHIQGI